MEPTGEMILELMTCGLRHAEYKKGCDPTVAEMVEGYRAMLAAAPDVQREQVTVPAALRQIASWMDDGGPTHHEAELIGMAISGPVECSSAKRCTMAAKKALLEAARIWEHMHPDQLVEQQPASR